MKKLLLGLGTLSLAALPFMAVVSCGGTTEKPEAVVDIKITPKTGTLELHQDELLADKVWPVETLSKLFDGIDTANIANIETKYAGTDMTNDTKGKVMLIAKTGFTINKKLTLESAEFTITRPVVLKITPKAGAITLLPADFSTPNALSSLTTLKKVFEGPDLEANLPNLTATITHVGNPSTSTKGKITLTAAKGFSINGKPTLESSEFTIDRVLDIIITPKTGTLTLHEDELLADKVWPIATLNKLFDGINTTNIANIETKYVGPNIATDTKGKVMLTAKPGFTINKKPTLESAEFTITRPVVLNITPKTGSITLMLSDIATPSAFSSLTTLQKVFEGPALIASNLPNLTTTITHNGDPSTSTTAKITLTAAKGFNINGKPTLESSEFTINRIVNLTITPKATPTPLTAEEATLTNVKKLTTLNKLFEGADLIEANLSNLEISIIEIVEGNTLVVRILAKPGFTINGTDKIYSNPTPNPRPAPTTTVGLIAKRDIYN